MKTKTKIPGVTLGGEHNGSSLAGYMSAPYKALRTLLGPPNCEGDGYKVSTEWVVTFGGQTYTIYDYKETRGYDRDLPSVRTFRALPVYDWHIGHGGGSRANISAFRNAVMAAVEALDDVGPPEPSPSIH